MEWDFYWKRHPDGPFTTLIAVATTYLHPEADELELLQERAKDNDDDSEMRVFKDELRQAITHPDQVPRYELSSHVQYDDGSPGKFLRRLWRDLYGDEPVPGPRAGLSPGAAAKPEAASGRAGRLRPSSRSRARYLSESVNLAHASAGTLSVKPSRSVVSRTRIMPAPLAVSTQELPDVPE